LSRSCTHYYHDFYPTEEGIGYFYTISVNVTTSLWREIKTGRIESERKDFAYNISSLYIEERENEPIKLFSKNFVRQILRVSEHMRI